MRNVLLTGATGFVGRGILERLLDMPDIMIHAPTRRPQILEGMDRVTPHATDLCHDRIAPDVMERIEVVIHAAATVHLPAGRSEGELERIYATDVSAALTLAEDAAKAGTRRFVFVSSIKVNGENTNGRGPFTEADQPAPVDPYGRSKARIEQELAALCSRTGMEVVIVRPPLVYGAGVGANFAQLVRLARLGLPLPLGSIRNRRSLIGRDNLADFIAVCMDHPLAANSLFLVSDGHDISTPDLVRAIAAAGGHGSRLFPMPLKMLEAAAWIVGKAGVLEKLTSSLQVDPSKARMLLNWTPPVDFASALKQTVAPTAD